MSYINTIEREKARLNAVKEVISGKKVAKVARLYGCHRSTIYSWLKRYEEIRKEVAITGEVIKSIPTKSSRPHNSPRRVNYYIESQIIDVRKEIGRCAEVIHREILNRGLQISLSSVRRILQRNHLTNYNPKYKRRRKPISRPKAKSPGALVEMDTVVFRHPVTKKYSYATSVVDVYSRMSYVYFHAKNDTYNSFIALLNARNYFPFKIEMIQTDNGAEFGRAFQLETNKIGIKYRHTRVRQPNDNAHVERFNRTLREECLGAYISLSESIEQVQNKIDTWVEYYNYHRLHMGIDLLYPATLAHLSF